MKNFVDLSCFYYWKNRPEKCDCGEVLKPTCFSVLRCGHKAVWLEVLCNCDKNWLVDTEGRSFLITEF